MKENMKKNKSFIVALCMIALCLITTVVIGTTLAKYTTSGSAKDEARIAKWGVSVSMEADPLFQNEYIITGDTITVKSSDDAKVVAPGTSSDEVNGSAIFTIVGTPEVRTQIKIEMTNVSDVYLKAGNYKDPTGESAIFTLDKEYCPVVFTLVKKGDGTTGDITLATGKLSDIKTAFENESASHNVNDVLDAKYELSWKWVYEGGNDAADTYLGNLMAGQNPDSLIENTDYSLKVKYELKITVTQVD